MEIIMLCESNLYFEVLSLKVPLFAVSQATPTCPSNKSNIKVKLSMDQWWNGTDRGQLEYSQEYLTQCHFAHHKLDQEVFRYWIWASAAKGWHIAKCRLWPHVEQSCYVQRGWAGHLLLCGEMSAVCYKEHTKHGNTLCKQKADIFNVKAYGTYS